MTLLRRSDKGERRLASEGRWERPVRPLLLLLAAFGCITIAVGCGGAETGRVDFDRDPDFKSIGAPRVVPKVRASSPARPATKKNEYQPG